MGLDLASELHWLAFRKRVCYVKSWKHNDGLGFSRSLETCIHVHWRGWAFIVRSRRCICQEDIHHATMWIGGHCHRKMNLHHRIQSNFLKGYPNPDDRASAGSELLFSTPRRRRCNFAIDDECDRRRRRSVTSAQERR